MTRIKKKTVTLAKRMIAHLDQKQIIIDGSNIQETIRQNWGAPAIMQQLWDRFSMDRIITNKAKADAIKSA